MTIRRTMSIVALLAMLVSVIVPATAFASDDDATDTSGPITPAADDIEQLPTPPDEPIDPIEAAEPSGSGLAPPDFDDPIILDDTEPQPEDLDGDLEVTGEPADPTDLAEEFDGQGETGEVGELDTEALDELEMLEAEVLDESLEPETFAVTIAAKALDDHECNANEWQFVITGVGKRGPFSFDLSAPPSIMVTWENGQSESVALAEVTGGVAHYTTISNLDSPVVSATASVDVIWMGIWLARRGQFNLSHGPCEFNDEPDTYEVMPQKSWEGDVPDGAIATITLIASNDATKTWQFDTNGALVTDIYDGDPMTLPLEVWIVGVSESYDAEGYDCYATLANGAQVRVVALPDGPVVIPVINTCELPDPYLVIPAKQWEISGVASPTGYTEITITADGGSPSKTWRIGVDGEFITEGGFDDQPLEIPGHLGYSVSEQLVLGDGLECVVSILENGNNGDNGNNDEGNGDPAVEALRGPPHRRPGSGRPGGHRRPCGGCQPEPELVQVTVTLLNVCDIPEDEPNGTTTIRIPPPEIPEPEPEVEIQFTKTWLGVEDLDMAGVEVTFLVDGVEVALGETLSVDPGETLTLSESVDGLPGECSYTSTIPASYTVPVDVEDGDVFTIAVTNDVTCVLPTPILIAPPFDDPVVPPLEPEPEPEPEPLPEPEPEEPEVLPEIIEEPEAPEPTEEVAEVVLVATPLPRTGASTALLSLIAMLLLATGTTLLRRRRGSTR